MHEGHTEAKKEGGEEGGGKGKGRRKAEEGETRSTKARRGEGDWVVSRPTSLTPIEGCLVGSDEGRRDAGGNGAALVDYRGG